jgi:hypothetical protein
MAEFDASVAEVDHRRSTNESLKPSSEKRYACCYRRYREWCAMKGYQAGSDWIDAEKVAEFTIFMTTDHRYSTQTIYHTIRALELYAERAGRPVSGRMARGVLDSYRIALAQQGEGAAPKRGRRRVS